MNLDTAKYRLRGFMCKVAALLSSPFEESLLVDLDVVFFRKPEVLFESPGYRRTGALFMRDRTYIQHKTGRFNPVLALKFFSQNGLGLNISLNSTAHEKLLASNGVSLFWRYGGNVMIAPNTPLLGDIQDSSVVVLDKRSHPSTLKHFAKFIASFDVGYGDKEMFWMIATLAGEGFEFSPFLAGQYGDCDGVILHFDPRDEAAASPLYVNGEKIVERELNYVGDFLSESQTQAVRVDIGSVEGAVRDMRTWAHYRHEKNCSCDVSSYQCTRVSTAVNAHLLVAEWITFTRRHWLEHYREAEAGSVAGTTANMGDAPQPGGAGTRCVPVVQDFATRLMDALHSLVTTPLSFPSPLASTPKAQSHLSSLCGFIGCPLIDSAGLASHFQSARKGHVELCIPFSFSVASDVSRSSGSGSGIDLSSPRPSYNASTFQCHMKGGPASRTKQRVCYISSSPQASNARNSARVAHKM